MPVFRSGKESDFKNPRGFVEIETGNGLPLIVYTDELWEQFNGTQGRVNIRLTIERLATLIDRIDDAKLAELVKKLSQDKGIHGGRLELTMEHGHVSSNDFAVAILAYHFNVSAEVLVELGSRDVFSGRSVLPGDQAEGLKLRLLREGRLQQIQMWDASTGEVVHLLSNGTLFKVMR